MLELRISNKVSGVSSGTVEGWVDAALGSRTYTNVMYVLPESVNFNGAAACKSYDLKVCVTVSFELDLTALFNLILQMLTLVGTSLSSGTTMPQLCWF